MTNMYALVAWCHRFDGTENDPRTDSHVVAISDNYKKLEALETALVNGQEQKVDALKNSRTSSTDTAEINLGSTYGTVRIAYFPVDDYYGCGSVNYYTIENYISPSVI